MKARWGALLLAAWIGPVAVPAAAVEFSVSGFGTAGYARSDQAYTYQLFIDDSGTFWRDTVAGLQVDARLADTFGATVQFKLAPATNSDDEYNGTVSWAFLSWRPSNDWLIRLGKSRAPLYLFSETKDVGVTYDFARLPTEMYSIVSNDDYTGLSVIKNWAVGEGDLSLQGYVGKGEVDFRFWIRDNIPPIQRAGPIFQVEDVRAGGLLLSYRQTDDIYRISAFRGTGKLKNGLRAPTTYPFVALAPGIGYYQVTDSLPGPGVPTTDSFTLTVVALGVDVGLAAGFRVVGEFARSFVPDTDVSLASTRGYAALLKQIDNWTPYLVYAFLRSTPEVRNLYNSVNYNTVPGFIPGAALINASQRTGADYLISWDQHSWSMGTSYSFSATSKLKVEYMRTHIGQMSSLVDAPSGGNIRDQNINVFSLSYNFLF
jgi:hypothetical protein